MIGGAVSGAGSLAAGSAVADQSSEVLRSPVLPFTIGVGAGAAMVTAGIVCLVIEQATK